MKLISSLTRTTATEERMGHHFYSKYELFFRDRKCDPLVLSDSHYKDGRNQHGGCGAVQEGRERDLRVRRAFPMLTFLFWDEDQCPVFELDGEQIKFHYSGESLSV